MKKSFVFVVVMALIYASALAAPHIYEKKYHALTVWLDCQRHGAIVFFNELNKDKGNMWRDSGNFKTDSVPFTGQPKSGDY